MSRLKCTKSGKSFASRHCETRNSAEDKVKTMINRESAWGLLIEFTQSESLRKHALAVEACMRSCARKFAGAGSHQALASCQGMPSGMPPAEPKSAGASAPEGMSAEDLWGIVGLIHDFDYERWPSLDDHPYKGNEILKQRGWPEIITRAVMSHAEYTGVTRDTPMEKALFACDELAGLITATALVKPSKSLAEVDAKSVRKKMKDKAFARSVNRDDIVNGARDLGVDLEEHIAFCIEAMKGIARELGLESAAIT